MDESLEALFSEIEGSVSAGFYMLPVVMAAAIPDICAALEAPDGRSTRDGYQSWFDRWAKSKMTLITAEDCYSFRCGVVHQGRMGDMKNSVARIVFPLPGFAHIANNIFNDGYIYGVKEFCVDMTSSAREWYSEEGLNDHVQSNLTRLMRVYPDGLAPYIGGLPVLA